MPGVFGDQHIGDHRLGRQSALDQPFGRRRLHHGLLAGPAGIFGTMRHDHPELRRNDIEPLRPSPRRSHAWVPGSRGSWCLPARSSHRRAADGREALPRLARRLSARRARPRGSFLSSAASSPATACSISSSASSSCSGSSFSERAAELRALQLAQQMLQAIHLRQRLVALGERGVPLRTRRRKQRLQRVNVGGNADLRSRSRSGTKPDSRAVVTGNAH